MRPVDDAERLSSLFLNVVAPRGARFATNSSHVAGDGPPGWSPATEYTFDAGVVVLHSGGAAVFWVADED
jgi:hypothetical protein